MEITPMIRTEIDRYLKHQGITMTEFGHMTDLNVGTVSGIVTGNRSISVNQLDRITAGMGLPPDYFYERYIEECIIESPLNWRKISPFLYRCAVLGRLDCIQRVVSILLDTPIYISLLFELAEEFFQKAYQDPAALLYENVAESEKKQHSERLAVCQYRLFSIRIGKDQAQNLQTAAKFEPFVDRLDEFEQLDALKDLANVYRALSLWDKVTEFSYQMGRLAQIQYDLAHNSKGKERELKNTPSKPLFTYIAYSELLCANACDARGEHKQALEHIHRYADLSWVKENDPDSLYWKQQYQQWAKINFYVNRLMSGDINVLPDYVEYMAGEKEIFAELLNIIEAANRYNIDVDHILQRFESQIAAYREPSSSDTYTQQFLPQQYVRFWYKTAKYSLNKGRYTFGFKCLIKAFEKAVTIDHGLLIANCVGLFSRFSTHAAPETHAQFQSMHEEVWNRNDKKDGFNLSDS
ncbi:helix-turn-helix domain-containing protein [Paenibacillus polymyxa]|uniref:helix-turn-helix domain-containing protein n=1 Tax=Paenibacillus polymyxa TaxID=1406 RepID=UPI0004DF47E0|nr:helix-turn-helix transcriptional regulator [Paenibacillus polymyxa]MEE4580598.1 helix-turn-helix transcriptional regulator [Paenibacillus polymyxa]RPE01159.1 XRE family transcriptional regulator [Paenibacillus polymyxa]